MSEDDRLKEIFTALRRADESRLAPFEAMAHAPRARRPRLSGARVAVMIGGLAAAAGFVLLLGGAMTTRRADAPVRPYLSQATPVAAPPPQPVPPFAHVAAAPSNARGLDPAPLDFLLEMPALGPLASAPSFDDTHLPGSLR